MNGNKNENDSHYPILTMNNIYDRIYRSLIVSNKIQ